MYEPKSIFENPGEGTRKFLGGNGARGLETAETMSKSIATTVGRKLGKAKGKKE